LKKLLLVLLTLVMATTLINLNNSFTKAEDTSSNVVVTGKLKIQESDGHLKLVYNAGGEDDLDDGQTAHENIKTQLGIQHDYTNHVLTLSSDLSSSSILLDIYTDEKIVLSNNIKLTKTSTNDTTIAIENTVSNIEINGGDSINTLTITPTVSTYSGIACANSNLTLKNINLVISGDFIDYSLATSNLSIDEYSSVVLKNTNATGGALFSGGTLTIPDNYEILGSTSLNPSEADLKVAVKDNDVYKVVDAGGNLQVAKYIVIRKKTRA